MKPWSGFWNWLIGRDGPARADEPASADIGPRSPSVATLTHLARDLTHREAVRRRLAAESLAELGPDAADVVPDLIVGLTDVDEPVRRDVAAALKRIDPEWPSTPRAVEAVPRLLRALTNNYGTVSQAAATTLAMIGPGAVPGLVATLDADDPIAAIGAARTLGRLRTAPDTVVPAVARALRSDNVGLRQAAAEALAAFGPDAAEAVPALTATLADWSPPVRLSVTAALGRVGPAAASAATPLVPLLVDHDEDVRRAAIDALAKIGPTAAPLLIGLLRERDPARDLDLCFRHCREERWAERMHQAVAIVLGRLGSAARDAVPLLIAAADDADAGVREAAVRSLGRIGAETPEAVVCVVAAQVDRSAPVRAAAAEALPGLDRAWAERTETARVIPVLLGRMTGQADGVCKAAREALVRVGPAAVGALAEALAAPDRVVREAAAGVLGEIGAGARDALPALTRIAEQDGSVWVRQAAARAIECINAAQAPHGNGPP